MVTVVCKRQIYIHKMHTHGAVFFLSFLFALLCFELRFIVIFFFFFSTKSSAAFVTIVGATATHCVAVVREFSYVRVLFCFFLCVSQIIRFVVGSFSLSNTYIHRNMDGETKNIESMCAEEHDFVFKFSF